ncbi:hypothetical protein ALQ60_02000 [Pseudomonas syringae pv. papulans]|nr:Unknown protein sequence [Pseudomonas syringae pv. papulans]KWS33160.1 hypothetical protein AL059_12085 [Pseudomonas syringae pv. papulans]RMN47877.1 hypothetical protein ALQ60_02000 [Pseudomonas syringae pv. papulans]RMN62643.1 hypothetical protein ALQ56_00630 [Pseudomonas syringae pv. papulans]RMV50011.1 hypothetical protein ALP11_00255 [Pseudomonas syringae pv. papulans]
MYQRGKVILVIKVPPKTFDSEKHSKWKARVFSGFFVSIGELLSTVSQRESRGSANVMQALYRCR